LSQGSRCFPELSSCRYRGHRLLQGSRGFPCWIFSSSSVDEYESNQILNKQQHWFHVFDHLSYSDNPLPFGKVLS
jgi:hypothetical protein